MAYQENQGNTTFHRNTDPNSYACRTSVFFIYLSVIIAFLLMIGLFHPGI